MTPRKILWLFLPAIVPLLSACYEEPGVTFFEPGQYQGRADPLLAVQASPEQQQRLEQRLRTVQMDR